MLQMLIEKMRKRRPCTLLKERYKIMIWGYANHVGELDKAPIETYPIQSKEAFGEQEDIYVTRQHCWQAQLISPNTKWHSIMHTL